MASAASGATLWSTWTFTLDTQALAVGWHGVTAQARDAAGNWQSEINATLYSWIVDTAAPQLVAFFPPPDTVLGSTENIGVTFSEIVDSDSMVLDDAPGDVAPSDSLGGIILVPQGNWTLGPLSLVVSGADAAGNSFAFDANYTVVQHVYRT